MLVDVIIQWIEDNLDRYLEADIKVRPAKDHEQYEYDYEYCPVKIEYRTDKLSKALHKQFRNYTNESIAEAKLRALREYIESRGWTGIKTLDWDIFKGNLLGIIEGRSWRRKL
jgi:hypothetical protein